MLAYTYLNNIHFLQSRTVTTGFINVYDVTTGFLKKNLKIIKKFNEVTFWNFRDVSTGFLIHSVDSGGIF